MRVAPNARPASAGQAPRLLIVAPNWLGDAVMALPALEDVRRHFPHGHLTVAGRAAVLPIFEWAPGVDAVVRLGTGRIGWWPGPSSDIDCVRGARADIAVLLPNSFRSAWLIRRAGIRERWGYRRDGRGWLLTRAVARPGGMGHQAEYYQALTRALGMANGRLEVAVQVPAHAVDEAGAILRQAGWAAGQRFVGIAPGAAYGHAKRWLPERFAELIDLLSAAGLQAVLVGSRGDMDAGRAIEAALASTSRGGRLRPINLIGRTSLDAVAGVMACSCSFVSNDSGAMHLAAAVGAPVTAVFGASDERGTAPLPFAGRPDGTGGDATGDHRAPAVLTERVWCRPCMLRECPVDHRCMSRITAERVFESVMRQVQGCGERCPVRDLERTEGA